MGTDYPVITIDGPAASGKGTLAQQLSADLGFNLLDSGLLYRIVAYTAGIAEIRMHDAPALDVFMRERLRFKINTEPSRKVPKGTFEVYIFKTPDVEEIVSINGRNVLLALRSRDCGVNSSLVSSISEVRRQLIPIQRSLRIPPGLVADGRDMGTVVFPDADLKFYLDASVEVRAKRRLVQLEQPADLVSMEKMIREIEQRDQRDRTRDIAPLVVADDSHQLDTSTLTIEQMYNYTRLVVRERIGL